MKWTLHALLSVLLMDSLCTRASCVCYRLIRRITFCVNWFWC